MQEDRIKWLICQYLDEELTDEENTELQELVIRYPELSRLLERLSDDTSLAEDLRQWESFMPVNDHQRTQTSGAGSGPPHKSCAHIKRIALAAAIVIVLSGTLIWLIHAPAKQITADPPAIPHDALPGGSHASLTLANGRTISLDSISSGNITDQPGSRIALADSTTLLYTSTHTAVPGTIPYNKLTTPRGGQFDVVLADGTHVWLNNASSIRYPTVFTGKERVVECTGEAYFEIGKDASRPFRVMTHGFSVHVLGTRFVIASFADEGQSQATLLDGKIQVLALSKTQNLSPGDRLVFTSPQNDTAAGSMQIQHDADADEAMAWKVGYFHFVNTRLRAILRQIGRWYDVDIDIPASIPDDAYTGEIDRHLPLSALLSFLTKPDLHFTITGKKLTVMK